MIYLIKTDLHRLCLMVFLLFSSSIGFAQDVELNTQADVDAFFPGSIYNGNILIGRVGSGQASDIINLFNFTVLEELNGNLTISLNSNLTNLDDLLNLTTINGDLQIITNSSLTNLNGLSGLETVSQSLRVTNNDALISLNGLNGVSNVSGEIRFFGNEVLTEITGFSNITGPLLNLEINNNNSLVTIDGFNSLNNVSGIYISLNTSLESILGFSSLTTVTDAALSLQVNPLLTNISGFSQVQSVFQLSIVSNASLTNLDAFYNLIHVEEILHVFTNDNLVDCCGIQHLLLDPNLSIPIIGFFQNPSECSSESEIINNYCGLRFNLSKNPPCIGESNGTFQIYVTNYDVIPFYYQWERQEDGQMGSGTSSSNYFTIDNLEAGTYDIMLTTTKPDTAYQYNVVLTELNGTVFEIVQIESTNSSNGASNGSIEIIVSGGTPPYEVNWFGPINGSQPDAMSDTITIPFLSYGEYFITIKDVNGIEKQVTLTLLDDVVPTVPCAEPLDIIILNDVSGSVDSTEYNESKDFFLDFLAAINIGLGSEDSRAAIVEWSNDDQQELKIPITGDINILNNYANAQRSYSEGTAIHEAMDFGEEYLESVARPDVERVLILATDGEAGQVPPSLVVLADQYKANGYHILTIAFDDAYNDSRPRQILFQMASIGALAPGAPSYSDLDNDLARNIVNTYLCPIDPGESSNVYFGRDGVINIDTLVAIANCANPKFVQVTFTIDALRELSIPGGTYVTFYLNDPEQFGATHLLSWQIPCSIPVDSSETFTITLPMNGPSHIFAVLNDDGSMGPPINFPITDLEEIAYSNNIDDEWICVGDSPTLQAIKYTNTPTPSCDTIVNYTINVCNISEADAVDVQVIDQAPDDFVLINSYYILNDCATENSNSFDIAAGCCLIISLTYDASSAIFGYYGDQGVLLDGPADQEYFGYDGSTSTAEDVILDGTIDCPSTIVEFIKEVSVTESCDDAFLTFTFTINNELNFPLQGLSFSDIAPFPSQWVFEPYNLSGLSIGTQSINQNIAQFVIDEVQAETVASFSFDLSLGFWDEDDILLNSATLDNIPDFENGGTKTLTSNTTTSQIISSPTIDLPDTIYVQSHSDSILLDVIFNSQVSVTWDTEGDGSFTDAMSSTTYYVLGVQDEFLEQVSLQLTAENDCYTESKNVTILLTRCYLSILEFEVGDCDMNGTGNDSTDDTFPINVNISALHPGIDSNYLVILGNDTIAIFPYDSDNTFSLPADGTVHTITFVDSEVQECFAMSTASRESCSDLCELDLVQLFVSDCDDNGTPDDPSDDIYSINFNIEAEFPGSDSLFRLVLGNDTLEGFTYFEDQSIIVNSSNSNSQIQFIDSQIESCFEAINVGVENCIYPCEIAIEEIEVSACDNNGTMDDESDDIYTVTFNISSRYPGIDSTYFVTIGPDTIGEFSYDLQEVITLPADGLDIEINFVDSEFPECIISQTVNVDGCSFPCALSIDQFIESDCDDNGTPLIDGDDTFTVTFNISSVYPGADSTYFVVIGSDTIDELEYDSEEMITLQADGSDILLDFVDSQFPECSLSETANQVSCSFPCALSIDQFIESDCDDNGTPLDTTDDTFSVTFNISSVYPGSDSTFIVSIDTDSIGEYPYGAVQVISLTANGFNQITFTDSQISDCSISNVVNVSNCSDPCELSLDFIDISECDDNNTPYEINDDSYSITFNLSKANHPSDSEFYAFIENDTLGRFAYDTDHTLILVANGTVEEISFADTEVEYCTTSSFINLEICSEIELIVDDILIPNIFSPNQDGINDDWSITINNNIEVISCDIFDRWGNLIYKSAPTESPIWDGRFNGKLLEQGVFVYKIIYQKSTGEREVLAGDLTLVR